ncbi:MAG TPA: CehA/McbA family metallohydrolase [Pirellulales bacterium]|nr:CehA/McbA family metallohydrolase [Pirellulales bacterium]
MRNSFNLKRAPYGWRLPYLVLIAAIVVARHSCRGADGQLLLTVVDKESGQPIACRIHLLNSNGRPVKMPGTAAWADHFDFKDKALLKLPVGSYSFVIERGLEYLEMNGHFRIEHFADDSKQIELRRFCDMAKEGWWSGDVDIHRPEKDLPLLLNAEDLHIAPLTTFSNTKSEWSKRTLPAKPLVQVGGNRYYHLLGGDDAAPGGMLAYLNLSEPIELKPPTVEAPLDHIAEARKQAGAWIDVRSASAWDLPIWIAEGKVDSIDVLDRQFIRDGGTPPVMPGDRPRDKHQYPPPTGIGRWSQKVYYHLLNCGLRIPPSAGSGSGIASNPAGYNRMYVYCGDQFSYDKWWVGFREGKVVITNGPMLRPTVEGYPPGHVFKAAAGEKVDLEIGLTLSTRDKISYLEIVQDGVAIHQVRLDQWQKANGKLPHVVFDHSAWFLVRAVADTGKTSRFAMTAPYYVEIGDSQRINRGSAQFFLDWVNEREAQLKVDDQALRDATRAEINAARQFWMKMVAKANAD